MNSNPPDVSKHAKTMSPTIAQASASTERCSLSIPLFEISQLTYNGALSRITSNKIGIGSNAVSWYLVISSISSRIMLKLIETGRAIANNTHTPAERTTDEITSMFLISWTKP